MFVPVHAVQVAPLRPHWPLVGGVTQVVPLQQPVTQLPALQVPPSVPASGATQVPPWQVAPPVQPVQVAPLVPHWLLVGGEMQVVPAQQPLGQVLELHTPPSCPPSEGEVHTPLLHVWPPPQAAHTAPLVPH